MWWYVAAAGISAVSANRRSKAAARQADNQAAIADVQAQISLQTAKFNADRQLELGREQATFQRKKSRKIVGQAVVNVAGSGIEISGSPLAVIGEQIRQDELNAAKLITNASARALSERAAGEGAAVGFRATAAGLRDEASDIRGAMFIDMLARGAAAAGGVATLTGGSADPNQTPFSFDIYSDEAFVL